MRLVSTYYNEFYPFNQLQNVIDMVFSNEPDDLTEGDMLLVWGGGDISPTLYNKTPSRQSGATAKLSERDKIEWGMMQRANELHLPIVGVCRGAQMLCALAGGFLVQHVTNHGGRHEVTTKEGGKLITNSIHHQMLYPWGVEHEMLAVMEVPLSTIYVSEDTTVQVPEEPEYVYFPTVRGFAIQWHPEMMDSNSAATQYVLSTIEEKLNA